MLPLVLDVHSVLFWLLSTATTNLVRRQHVRRTRYDSTDSTRNRLGGGILRRRRVRSNQSQSAEGTRRPCPNLFAQVLDRSDVREADPRPGRLVGRNCSRSCSETGQERTPVLG